jgi:hypothetical protein
MQSLFCKPLQATTLPILRKQKETFVALKVAGMPNTPSNLSVTQTLQKYQTKKGAKVRAGALELRALFDA